MGYHYGETIREYRKLQGLTLSQLAEKWPSKDTGATSRYVSDIERGVKHVQDISVLRALSQLLQIPLWKFGLSEYNPFQGIQDHLLQASSIKENFALLDSFIQQLWITKVTCGMNIDTHLVTISVHLKDMVSHYPPSLFEHTDFLRVYAQITRLQAVRAYDQKDYKRSLQFFFEMADIAKRDGNPVSVALANMGIGVELMRDNQLEQVEHFLLRAKDATFHTGKELAGLVHGMLARYYATIHDRSRFENYYHQALDFGEHLGNNRLNTQDYVFSSFSGIMEEGSNGFILLNDGKKALALLPDIERQIDRESNTYLGMWIPLDYAQAHLCLNEIEESLRYLQMYVDKTRFMRTEHISSKINDHLQAIHAKGYGDLHRVKEFREMLREEEKERFLE